MEALRAAVQNGADAVYLGCGTFNARQSAKNFTPQTLVEAVKYCHVRGVAVHLTFNTLISDTEESQVCDLIRHAAVSGVDAFIVQDLGVVELCHRIAPTVPIHGSTQMTIHSLAGVRLCAAWGMSRVVLSRELSREEIAYICQNSPIEIEVFAHGALCMCYSGQCYLSAAIGGRSGNRGRCAQPCRQSYGYGRWENRYPLSLKDNCLIRELKELEAMGVASIKLEGRMKRPEYVATVTGTYRKALDEGGVTRPMMQELARAFNRQGFTDGYYTRRIGPAMFGIREDHQEPPSGMAAVRQSYDGVENGRVDIKFIMNVLADRSSLTVFDTEGRHCTVAGPVPEEARTVMLTEEAVKDRLRKTGGTPFRCTDVEAVVEPGFTLSAAAINAMRRDALNQLMALRARREAPAVNKPVRTPNHPGPKGLPVITAQVTNREQLTPALLRTNLGALYVPLHILAEDPALCQSLTSRMTVAAVLPRIVHDGEMARVMGQLRAVKALGVNEALVGNLGLLIPVREAGLAIRGDFGLNIFNSRAVNLLREMDFKSACLSFEMTLPQIRDVSKGVPCEIIAYGRLPLMVTENCLFKNRTGECSCRQGSAKLIDKTGAEFPVIKDGTSCRSVLLNGKKLSWLDRGDDLAKLGLWGQRLYFTTENPREVDGVLKALRERAPFDPGACTRGLYLRGVE